VNGVSGVNGSDVNSGTSGVNSEVGGGKKPIAPRRTPERNQLHSHSPPAIHTPPISASFELTPQNYPPLASRAIASSADAAVEAWPAAEPWATNAANAANAAAPRSSPADARPAPVSVDGLDVDPVWGDTALGRVGAEEEETAAGRGSGGAGRGGGSIPRGTSSEGSGEADAIFAFQ